MEYRKCLVEVDEILNYLAEEELDKIPYEIRKAIHEKKDTQYIWSYDETKTLGEQNINRKTIAILSYLNMEYLLNKEQKLIMEEIHKNNEKNVEKEKVKKYDNKNIFEKANRDKYIILETHENNRNTELIEYKESFFTRFKNFILKTLYLNK